MKKFTLILFAILICTGRLLLAQSLPLPDHIIIVLEENHAYEQIMGDSSAKAPYINSLAIDTDGALFTQSYALTHPSQPNYLFFFSGDDQGVTSDDITSTQFTTCNLGAALLDGGYGFIGYSEDEPSIGSLDDTYANYARKHAPWTNWQGSSTNGIPTSSNVPYTLFPTNYDSLPTVSFVIPNLNDDMHNGTVSEGDTWLENNLNNYITWAKSHNSLFILTFDEDDNNHYDHITTIFVGQMVKGGSYTDSIIHYNILRTIEDIYGLSHCANSDSVDPITKIWKNTATGINNLSVNNYQLSIYPNPASNQLTVESGQLTVNKITITDVLGQTVLQYTPTVNNPASINLNVSQFAAGMYFITIVSGNNTETKKFVVNR